MTTNPVLRQVSVRYDMPPMGELSIGTTAELLAGCDCPTCSRPRLSTVRTRVKIAGTWREIVFRGGIVEVPPRHAGTHDWQAKFGAWRQE